MVWGANNENFEALKKQFPKLKIVARGTEVKVLGDETELHLFQAKFSEILKHIEQYQSLTTNDILHILGSPENSADAEKSTQWYCS
jgi:phosphate starvation-inducible PhoH-like protein